MNATIQIAEVLNVSPNQIKSVREMAWVYCVVVVGKRATFVSKKKVEVAKVETRQSIAVKVAELIGGNVWQGGDKIRVYLGKGYVEVGARSLNCKALNHYLAYSKIREAGLDAAYETTEAVSQQTTATVARRRRSCLDCDFTTSVLFGRGYCTDCYGEC